MVYVLLADGFEEVEAICPIDVLRRGGCEVKTVGVTGPVETGSHGIAVTCDLAGKKAFSALKGDPPEMLILPGGMPGTRHLDAWAGTDAFIEATENAGGILAAICAAPSVLGKRGKLKGKSASCYPGFEEDLEGALVSYDDVTVDGKVITARGAGCAMKFGLALLGALRGEDVSRRIAEAVIYK